MSSTWVNSTTPNTISEIRYTPFDPTKIKFSVWEKGLRLVITRKEMRQKIEEYVKFDFVVNAMPQDKIP